MQQIPSDKFRVFQGNLTFGIAWFLPPGRKGNVCLRDRKDKTTPRLIQFHTLKNAANPPFLGGFSIFGTVAA